VIASAIVFAPVVLPILPPAKLLAYMRAIHFEVPRTETSHTAALPQLFADQFGWEEMVQSVARVYTILPPDEQKRAAIFCQNYGEAGAINLYGPALGLPPVICSTNSFWERGYGNPPPEILIVLGSSAEELAGVFESCQLVGHITNREGVPNEETTDHPDIFLCCHLRRPWPEVWKRNRHFG